MKKVSVIIVIAFMALSGTSFGQKAEVLYFKANLRCCKARACDKLESNIKSIVNKNFSNDEVAFQRVKIADEENKTLVNKYDANSQTVVIVVDRMILNDKSYDISDMVARYKRSKNKKAVEKEIVDKIKSVL